LKKDQISLFLRKGEEVEVIDLYPENQLPKTVQFPDKQITLSFSDFQENGGIYYAREIGVSDRGEKRRLVLKNMKIVFNKSIPEKIFIQNKPPAFETRHLNQDG
jgi:hypothetical protein